MKWPVLVVCRALQHVSVFQKTKTSKETSKHTSRLAPQEEIQKATVFIRV